MFPITRRLKLDLFSLAQTEEAQRNYAGLARGVGVTTAADLVAALPEDGMGSDPAEVGAEGLRDVKVLGTVLGGRVTT